MLLLPTKERIQNKISYLNKFVSSWVSNAIVDEGFLEGDINFVFCDDTYLHKLNIEFLSHDTLTDVISFDYTVGKIISGEVFISIDRVKENAMLYNVSFDDELLRVIIHGVLHFCGYSDKSESDVLMMRNKENHYLSIFTKSL